MHMFSRRGWGLILGIVLVIVGLYIVLASPAGNQNGGPIASITPLADDVIVLTDPLPNARISSPLTVRGKARGTWFFEASFPLILTDWDGKIIAEGYAQALDDWMTTDWVDFEGTLTFLKPSYGERGSLILKKDNPSGLPEYDDAREITIFFQ